MTYKKIVTQKPKCNLKYYLQQPIFYKNLGGGGGILCQ